MVDFYDSKLDANETRNATITACQNDLAMVGGLVLFLTNVDDIVNCSGPGAGRSTGLTDMPATTVGIPEALLAAVASRLSAAPPPASTVTKKPADVLRRAGASSGTTSRRQGGLRRADAGRQ